jgi:hypothetical protein
MSNLHLFPVSALILALASGCTHDAGTSPLDGTWVDSQNEPGVGAGSLSLELSGDGTVTMTDAITQWMGNACTGSLSFSGIRWASTSSAITFSGTAACSGTIECDGLGPLSCSDDPGDASSVASGTLGYTLESNDDTLVLSDGSTSYTFTRGN